MANNRMYLYHPETGKAFYLARCNGIEWSLGTLVSSDGCYLYDLNDYFDDISYEIGKNVRSNDTTFKIIYENDTFPKNVIIWKKNDR